MFAPLSIPSPPADWTSLNITSWTSSIGWNLPFSINIPMLAICVIVGIVLATWWASRRLTKRGAEPGVIFDIAIWAIPLGIIGGRVYYVLSHFTTFFYPGGNFWATFALYPLSIYGAIIGGAVGAAIGCRLSGIRFWTFADAAAPALLLGQAIGLIGTYFQQDAFGYPTNAPWGLEIPSSNPQFPVGLADGQLFQPVFIYEIIWCVVGIALLLLVERMKHLQWGKLFALYLIWYGVGRSWFEAIRIDPSPTFLGVRPDEWASWIAIVLGIVILVAQSRRHPGVEPSPYRPGAEWVPPTAEVESTDTYSDDELEGTVALDAPENEVVDPNAKSEVGAKS